MTGCDTHAATQRKLTELSDICEQYGMENVVNQKDPRTDQQLVEQFASGVEKAFLAYKEKSNINRALLKCNFKEKKLTAKE